jgi:hypothetical protein
MRDAREDFLRAVDRAVIGALLDDGGAERPLALPGVLVGDQRMVADGFADLGRKIADDTALLQQGKSDIAAGMLTWIPEHRPKQRAGEAMLMSPDPDAAKAEAYFKRVSVNFFGRYNCRRTGWTSSNNR